MAVMRQCCNMNEIVITVKVRAKAKTRDLVVGPDGVYKVKTPRPAEQNKANDDVVDILADYFGISRNQIELLSGQTFNVKKFRIIK